MKIKIFLIIISLVLLIYSLILTIENWKMMTRLDICNSVFLKVALSGTAGLFVGNIPINWREGIK